MARPKISSGVILIPAQLLLILGGIACGAGGSEKQILDGYFRASRLRDNVTLGNIATVEYSPTQRGTVQSFTVTSVSDEQKRPLRIPELSKAHDDAKSAEEEFSKRKKTYQDENMAAIERVLKAERAKTPLKGKDAEVQAAWAKWRDEIGQHAKKVNEARTQLSAERGVAEISLQDARNPVDVTKHDGELLSKDVTIDAQVRTPEGQVVNKQLVVTMQRARLRRNNERDLTGRWIITGIKESGGAGAPTT